MTDCDGCGQPAGIERQGCHLCEHCNATWDQWQAVQESKTRVEAKRRQRCQDYVDGLSVAERGDTQRQLLDAVMRTMVWYQHLDSMRRNDG